MSPLLWLKRKPEDDFEADRVWSWGASVGRVVNYVGRRRMQGAKRAQKRGLLE